MVLVFAVMLDFRSVCVVHFERSFVPYLCVSICDLCIVYICMYMYMYMYIYMCVYICMYIYMYMYIYMCVYICMYSAVWWYILYTGSEWVMVRWRYQSDESWRCDFNAMFQVERIQQVSKSNPWMQARASSKSRSY